jgi:signal transduction histidine kinase
MDTQVSDQITEEQAALRRMAVLVARGATPEEIFAAVTAEVQWLLDSDLAAVGRYGPDQMLTIVARRGAVNGNQPVPRRTPLGGRNVTTLVFETGRPVRMDDFSQASGPSREVLRRLGIRSAVGVPISVEGRLWGIIFASNTDQEPLAADAEERLSGFTELVGTAIANAQARMDLRGYADEQAALRRVATLVARGAAPEEVLAAVVAEAGRLLGTDLTWVGRYEADGVVSLGAWSNSGAAVPFHAGTRTSLGGRNLITQVFQTGRPVRMDDYGAATGAVADVGHGWGCSAAVGAPIKVEGRLWGVMLAGVTCAERLPADAATRLVGFAELAGTAIANAQAHMELRGYADEQAALRRVATLVAADAPPEEVFASVVEEIGRVVTADFATLKRYDADGTATIVGLWGGTDACCPFAVSDRMRLGGRNVTTLVHQTGQPARIDDFDEATGTFAEAARSWGFRSAVGVPIRVAGRLWGAVIVGSACKAGLSADTEVRLAGFTELVGTAIANAEAQAALTASRARIVSAADEARRRIERDLHDGAQQRLVTLALQVREAQAMAPPEIGELATRLDGVAGGLETALEELRVIARGIHPAVLTDGGLGPALRALARSCAIPVSLRVRVGRLPGPVETAAYYVACEALANTVKHARASAAEVEVEADDGMLRVSVLDDGRGGAAFGCGSGVVGLKDRVEALGGWITLHSPPGAGTALEAHIPLEENYHHPAPDQPDCLSGRPGQRRSRCRR